MTTVHAPKNTIRRIDSVWMVISVDPTDQTEGVCAVSTPMGMMPLIAADEERLPWIMEQAKRMRDAGQAVKLIELTERKEVTIQ